MAFRKTQDPRELPNYAVAEASRYLQLPIATLRSWALGRTYPTRGGSRQFRPLIDLRGERMLSFYNLIEAHVLSALRREHNVALWKIRKALDYVGSHFPARHQLADHRFETDGVDLFLERYGRLINLSQEGQLAMRGIIKAYLRRIERDRKGLPIRLYPFTRKGMEPAHADEPRAVVIDPLVSFGRPVLRGTGIPIVAIAERYKAGESIAELADDYERAPGEIEEAIRSELQLEAA